VTATTLSVVEGPKEVLKLEESLQCASSMKDVPLAPCKVDRDL
jgi:hypothetical protein